MFEYTVIASDYVQGIGATNVVYVTVDATSEEAARHRAGEIIVRQDYAVHAIKDLGMRPLLKTVPEQGTNLAKRGRPKKA